MGQGSPIIYAPLTKLGVNYLKEAKVLLCVPVRIISQIHSRSSNYTFWPGRRKQEKEEGYGLGPVHTSPQGVSSMWVIFDQADINQTVRSNDIWISVLGDAWIVLRFPH